MQYLKPREVATLLDVKVDKARSLMRDMNPVNLGTEQREQLRVEISDLKAYLKRRTAAPRLSSFDRRNKLSSLRGSGPIPYRKLGS